MARTAAATGFVPPPYPHDRLGELRAIAEAAPGGLIDCSVGTPVDPLPEVVRRALDAASQIEAVREVLREIEAGDRPELLVVNKLDRADASQIRELCEGESAIAVSARTGEGIEKLLDVIADRLRELATVVELVVPYDRGDVLAALHRDGEVLIEVHAEIGTRVRARIDELDLGRYREFVTG